MANNKYRWSAWPKKWSTASRKCWNWFSTEMWHAHLAKRRQTQTRLDRMPCSRLCYGHRAQLGSMVNSHSSIWPVMSVVPTHRRPIGKRAWKVLRSINRCWRLRNVFVPLANKMLICRSASASWHRCCATRSSAKRARLVWLRWYRLVWIRASTHWIRYVMRIVSRNWSSKIRRCGTRQRTWRPTITITKMAMTMRTIILICDRLV